MGGGDVPDDGGDSSDGVGEEVKVNIRSANGSKFSVQVNLNSTVEDFKSIVAQKCEIPAEKQRLIYKGRILKDDQTLKSKGLQTDDTVHLVRGFATAAPADSTTRTDAGIQNTNSTSTNADSSEGGPDFGVDFFPEFARNGPGFHSDLFGAPLFGAEAGPENTINSPAPNTNPLPNPWASSGTDRTQTNTRVRAGRTHTNSRALVNPIGNAMPDSSGGVHLPDHDWMLRYMPELTTFNQLMQNPAIYQFLRIIISNLQRTDQILRSTPQLQNTLASNPELIRQLASSETMQQHLNFRGPLHSQIGPQTSRERAQNDGGTGGNMGLDILLDLLEVGTGGASRAEDTVPPEELYADQLSQLQAMGFHDDQENIRALMDSAGDVDAAIERLLEDNLF